MIEQSKILWSKLPVKEPKCEAYEKRVLEYDPTNAPNLFSVRPFQRQQPVSVYDLFPPQGDLCSCGCGRKLTGRQKRWATQECSFYAVSVRFIISGSLPTIQKFLRIYYGWKCSECGCNNKGHDMGANGVVSWIKVDHIIPVKHGGGACWLSNYQLLCHDCHVLKTNEDFNWKRKQPKGKTQLSLLPNKLASDNKTVKE